MARELDELRPELEALVDDAVTDDQLADQHARILARLAEAQSHDRVLAFPARRAASSRHRARPAARWLAAAAAAGLVAGLAAGRMLLPELDPAHDAEAPQFAVTAAPPMLMPAAVPMHVEEEEFLAEMETVLTNRRVPELRALDDLTPRAGALSLAPRR